VTQNSFLKIARQFRRYLLVGGLAFVVDYLTLYLLAAHAGLHYQLAAAIAFLCGLLVNYALCVSWIFDHRSYTSKRREFIVFSMIGLAGLLLNGLLIFLMTELIGLYYMYSKLVAAGLILIFNFALRRGILFSEKASGK
jgi:putative flippase GtrA